MKHYTQLTQEQRYQIDAYRKAGLNQTETAEQLEVDQSTISREIRRNQGRPGPSGPAARSGPPGRAPWIPYRGFGWAGPISHEWTDPYLKRDRQARGTLCLSLFCQR